MAEKRRLWRAHRTGREIRTSQAFTVNPRITKGNRSLPAPDAHREIPAPCRFPSRKTTCRQSLTGEARRITNPVYLAIFYGRLPAATAAKRNAPIPAELRTRKSGESAAPSVRSGCKPATQKPQQRRRHGTLKIHWATFWPFANSPSRCTRTSRFRLPKRAILP